MGYDQPSKGTTSPDGMYAATSTGSIDASNDDYDKTGMRRLMRFCYLY